MKERFERLAEVWGNLPTGRKISLSAAVIGIVVAECCYIGFFGY